MMASVKEPQEEGGNVVDLLLDADRPRRLDLAENLLAELLLPLEVPV